MLRQEAGCGRYMPVAPLQVIEFLEYVPHKCHIDVLVVMLRNIFFI
jgi:hypothetical protein